MPLWLSVRERLVLREASVRERQRMLLFLTLILLAEPEIEELKKVFYLRLAAGRGGGGGANLREIRIDEIPVHEGIKKVDNVVAALVAACCASFS